MTRRNESKLVTVKIIGIEGARKVAEINGGSPANPWYKGHIGEIYRAMRKDNGNYIILGAEGHGMSFGAEGPEMPPIHSCVGNRTICQEDAEVVLS